MFCIDGMNNNQTGNKVDYSMKNIINSVNKIAFALLYNLMYKTTDNIRQFLIQ